jgi:hypothetical protein
MKLVYAFKLTLVFLNAGGFKKKTGQKKGVVFDTFWIQKFI